MNARDLLAEAKRFGILLAPTDRGTLKYVGDPSVLDRLLPAIRQHKGELIALLTTAANDPEHLSRRWLVTQPNGAQVSLSRNPPATLAEIRADYPGCEVASDLSAATANADLHPHDAALAHAWLAAIGEDDATTRREYLENLAREPSGLGWLYAECVKLGIATWDAPACTTAIAQPEIPTHLEQTA